MKMQKYNGNFYLTIFHTSASCVHVEGETINTKECDLMDSGLGPEVNDGSQNVKVEHSERELS